MLGLKACATTARLINFFILFYFIFTLTPTFWAGTPSGTILCVLLLFTNFSNPHVPTLVNGIFDKLVSDNLFKNQNKTPKHLLGVSFGGF